MTMDQRKPYESKERNMKMKYIAALVGTVVGIAIAATLMFGGSSQESPTIPAALEGKWAAILAATPTPNLTPNLTPTPTPTSTVPTPEPVLTGDDPPRECFWAVDKWNEMAEANGPVYQQYTIGGEIGTGYEGWAEDQGYDTLTCIGETNPPSSTTPTAPTAPQMTPTPVSVPVPLPTSTPAPTPDPTAPPAPTPTPIDGEFLYDLGYNRCYPDGYGDGSVGADYLRSLYIDPTIGEGIVYYASGCLDGYNAGYNDGEDYYETIPRGPLP